MSTLYKFSTISVVKRMASVFMSGRSRLGEVCIFVKLVFKIITMKKNKKQPSETSDMPETPEPQISYVLQYERVISF